MAASIRGAVPGWTRAVTLAGLERATLAVASACLHGVSQGRACAAILAMAAAAVLSWGRAVIPVWGRILRWARAVTLPGVVTLAVIPGPPRGAGLDQACAAPQTLVPALAP
jgi:hypothetical protein